MTFNYSKKLFTLKICIALLFLLILTLPSCALFRDPTGECELLSIYTKETGSSHYIYGTLKITNTCDRNIYNATVSLQAESSKRMYYKTISLDITVSPEEAVFIPVEMSFTTTGTETEKWKSDTFKILSAYWK